MRGVSRFACIVVSAFVFGAAMAMPAAGSAHCSAEQGSFWAVIIGNTDDADFYASTNQISTYSLQTWGAPWCQITDTHTIQQYVNGVWVTKAYVKWTNYASVDSGWHPGIERKALFTGLPNGSFRFKCVAYRISSHNQLLGLPIGDQYQHLDDTHTSYETGSL